MNNLENNNNNFVKIIPETKNVFSLEDEYHELESLLRELKSKPEYEETVMKKIHFELVKENILSLGVRIEKIPESNSLKIISLSKSYVEKIERLENEKKEILKKLKNKKA